MAAIDLAPLLAILDGAPHVYVGVRTRTGPHVTPELFSVSGGRLVCLTAATTRKAAHARRDPVVAVAGRSPRGAFAAVAQVDVVDPLDPPTMLRSPAAAASSPVDVARFVHENAAELAGAVADAALGRLGVPPPHRVVLALTITDVALVDPPDAGGDVVLGRTRADGVPLALPARSDGGDAALLPRALFEQAGAAESSPACITADGWTSYGPSGKQGVMRRGTGRAVTRERDVRVELDVERVTEWDGVDVVTSDVGDPTERD